VAVTALSRDVVLALVLCLWQSLRTKLDGVCGPSLGLKDEVLGAGPGLTQASKLGWVVLSIN